jgi:hypothetical protein
VITPAERFGEKKLIAWLRAAFAHHLVGVDQPGHSEAVEGFRAVDRVSTGDGRARLAHLDRTAGENLGDPCGVQAVGEAGDVERKEHLAAHRVHVAHGVRRGDGAIGPRIVDDRREEIGGRDERARFVQPVDCGVIRLAQPDQHIGICSCREEPGQLAHDLR